MHINDIVLISLLPEKQQMKLYLKLEQHFGTQDLIVRMQDNRELLSMLKEVVFHK
jgi:hypothetical protein